MEWFHVEIEQRNPGGFMPHTPTAAPQIPSDSLFSLKILFFCFLSGRFDQWSAHVSPSPT